jgi:hypothetical protein
MQPSESVIRRSAAGKSVNAGLLFAGALGPNAPQAGHLCWGQLFFVGKEKGRGRRPIPFVKSGKQTAG